MRFKTALVVLLIISWFVSAAAYEGGYALVNGTIVTVTQGTIEHGTLIIEDEKITALGKNMSAPANVEQIDCTDLFIFPGMINSMSTIGLSEIGSVDVTDDASEVGTYNAHIKALVAVNPHSVHIPITRVNGITNSLTVPRGGIISGQSALLNLAGWTYQEMALKATAAIHVNFPQEWQRRRGAASTSEEASSRVEAQRKELTELFKKAQVYARAWASYKENPQKIAPELDLTLEALVPVVHGELPVIIQVDAEKDIKSAVEFAEEIGLNFILAGVSDGWKVADFLAEKNVPVMFGSVLSLPGSTEPYDTQYANAGIMQKAGVKVAIYVDGYSDVRSLPYHAGTAAAFGMDKEEALKSVTINPAEMLGVADLIGSLEVGKLANVVVADGDILEMRTKIQYLFIKGKKISLESKHTELYEKFRARPKKNK